jgi:hypothetical protein
LEKRDPEDTIDFDAIKDKWIYDDRYNEDDEDDENDEEDEE